jgi:thiol-disulfide isomerase/thioredoxin
MRNRQLLGVVIAAIIGLGAGDYLFHRQHAAATESATAGTALPDPGPLKDLSGQEYRLSHWQGKLVLFNFWASWCVPCKHEIPALIAAQQKYGSKGFQVIGIAVDDPDPARDAAKKLGIDYPVLQDSPDVLVPLMSSLGNDQGGLPFSAWVGADGRIFDRTLGELDEKELDSEIEAHLPKS